MSIHEPNLTSQDFEDAQNKSSPEGHKSSGSIVSRISRAPGARPVSSDTCTTVSADSSDTTSARSGTGHGANIPSGTAADASANVSGDTPSAVSIGSAAGAEGEDLQKMEQNAALLGKAMEGMLKDAFAEAVVNAALGDGGGESLTGNVQARLQALLSGNPYPGKPDHGNNTTEGTDSAAVQRTNDAGGAQCAGQSKGSADACTGCDAHIAKCSEQNHEHQDGEAEVVSGDDFVENQDTAAVIKKKLPQLELYTREQLKAVREHIEKVFGPIYLQVEDAGTEHIRCDIVIIKDSKAPSSDSSSSEPEGKDETSAADGSATRSQGQAQVSKDTDAGDSHSGGVQYLVTKGMGAHKMPVPEEFADLRLNRCELYMALPGSWDLEKDSEESTWPISLLNVLSRLPVMYDSWLAQGHLITFPEDENYAPGTSFAGAIILNHAPDINNGHKPALDEGAALHLSLPAASDGSSGEDEVVNFYQVIPLYAEEIAYAESYSARTLIRLMPPSSYIADASRPLTHLRRPKRSQGPL
ncbi:MULTISPECIES: suppressor of fused domain protein [unclassified Anaerobiospirillum]|uniref:suppressor of fused domain protein n=1 Tax=unclassified Anaerobiospirillum TaxID=2647410 RepID=UPI001FF3CAC0|nr:MULTISPECIES: suppressor of fused domain protein [unclassified Anaerobiospirillum]MCK0534724.1 suppressor of fused domain protein [Anaerobiospirillum sp. NML120511]MCK0539988.1 suppressor of fused domain protein [Anaerobiospirillum sp. NML02-A-032]